jgi:hypothetical protein
LTGEVLRYVWSQRPADTVLDQDLREGLKVTEGTHSTDGRQAVAARPAVVGKDRWTASRKLKHAGFDVNMHSCRLLLRWNGSSQTPNGQTPARPRSVVLLNVAMVPCTPGYSPCLPLGPPDYDCRGTGEGPAFRAGEGNWPDQRPRR